MSFRRARFSSQTARHGPTAAAGGDQPGVRPRRVVRNQRSCWFSTIGARHFGRGRFASRSASRAWKRISSSLAPARGCSMRHSWARNMLSLVSSDTPFSQASATVARPSKPNTSSSPGAGGSRLKRSRYHQSSLSKRRGGSSRLQAPAARRQLAAVEGAWAGSHCNEACDSSAGPAKAPGGVEQISQPAVSR